MSNSSKDKKQELAEDASLADLLKQRGQLRQEAVQTDAEIHNVQAELERRRDG